MSDQNKDIFYFVYDGQCPICQIGAGSYKLREDLGAYETIDARHQHDHPILQEVNQAGYDLDQGMVIKYKNLFYQGEEALMIMAQFGSKQGIFNLFNNTLFKSAKLAKFCYPFMRGGRNILLKIKGVKQINNLNK